jgi:hypothetical protein
MQSLNGNGCDADRLAEWTRRSGNGHDDPPCCESVREAWRRLSHRGGDHRAERVRHIRCSRVAHATTSGSAVSRLRGDPRRPAVPRLRLGNLHLYRALGARTRAAHEASSAAATARSRRVSALDATGNKRQWSRAAPEAGRGRAHGRGHGRLALAACGKKRPAFGRTRTNRRAAVLTAIAIHPFTGRRCLPSLRASDPIATPRGSSVVPFARRSAAVAMLRSACASISRACALTESVCR